MRLTANSAKRTIRGMKVASLAAPLFLAMPARAQDNINTIATFTGANGEDPSGSFYVDEKGTLIGATGGGAVGTASVYQVGNPSGAAGLGTIANFYGSGQLAPNVSVTADIYENLFVAVSSGQGGSDSIYEIRNTGLLIQPTYGSAQLLCTLGDGMGAMGPLTIAYNGEIFGTTATGGATNDGTVFELAKTGGDNTPTYTTTVTTLASFGTTSGVNPEAGVTFGDGNIYGTTFTGGIQGGGTIFTIAHTGTDSGGNPIFGSSISTVAAFTVASGINPDAPLTIDTDGNMFGTTTAGGNLSVNSGQGGGTMFELANLGTSSSPNYTGSSVNAVVAFNGADGLVPSSGLTTDSQNNIYGVTAYGGTGYDGTSDSGQGTVYEVKNSGTNSVPAYASADLKTLASFDGADGYIPSSSLTVDPNGILFGTTLLGGTSGHGTVFQLTPPELTIKNGNNVLGYGADHYKSINVIDTGVVQFCAGAVATISASAGGMLQITGGFIGNVIADDGGTIDISGGQFSGSIENDDPSDAIVNLFGSDFSLEDPTQDGSFVDWLVTGTLADGEGIDLEYREAGTNTTSPQGLTFNVGASAPEPGALTLLLSTALPIAFTAVQKRRG